MMGRIHADIFFRERYMLNDVGVKIKLVRSARFQVPRTRLKFGERAFSVAAAKSWNNLPLHVRIADNTDTFKRRLKTFLFCTFMIYDSQLLLCQLS